MSPHSTVTSLSEAESDSDEGAPTPPELAGEVPAARTGDAEDGGERLPGEEGAEGVWNTGSNGSFPHGETT